MGMVAPMPMRMGIPRMITDILTLSQWLSPSFPVGAFAYSHGLETEIQAGRLNSASGLQDWLADILEHGAGRSDCILLRAAHACDDLETLAHVEATARAFAPGAERLRETQLQGAAFGETVAAIWIAAQPELSYPVALGRAARLCGIDPSLAAALYLQAFASNLVSVAVRLVPLGQTEGQRVLAALAPLCQTLAAASNGAGLDDLSSSAFMSDIAAMRHETLNHRIFRS